MWRRAIVASVLGLLTLALLLWIAGFVWFLRVAVQAADPPPQADGIVVLTGGADRIETALRLLAAGRARRLLVSGVGGSVEFGELARRAGVDASLAAQVTLGRAASSTRGNAAEAADWVHANAVRTLIVVTAGYHMPRAVAELSRSLPEVALYPVPVLPPALRGARSVRDLTTLRLLAGEFMKWLAAEAGLSRLVSHGGDQPPNRPAQAPPSPAPAANASGTNVMCAFPFGAFEAGSLHGVRG